MTHILARWRRAIALACCVLTGSALGDSRPPPAVGEYDLKAALVFRTAKFIEWPASAFADEEAALVLCVAGDNATPLSSFRALEGKLIGTHAVNVRRITGDMLDLRQCHIAFFPRNAARDIGYAVHKLQAAPVLTVGEDAGFVAQGGMLALLRNDQRVNFTINITATRKAALEVSAQLLQLASIVQ